MSLRSITYGSGEPTFVFLHGLGANEEDLYPVAGELVPGTYHFLRAPHEYGYGGYAWYDVEFDATGVTGYDVAGALVARDSVIEFLSGIGRPVILGGFSQGAILSTGVGLARPDLVSGLVLWSGRLNAEFLPSPLAPLNTPVLQQHGTMDPVIPITQGRELARFWSGATSNHTYQEFPMGHGISPASLASTREWLLALE